MDQSLIEQVLKGNDHAFRIIIERYRQDLFRSIYAILRNQKDSEDALQEVFIKIYTSLPRYENQGFKTWITRIAVNHAIDMKRKQQRRRENLNEDIEQTISDDLQLESLEANILKKEKVLLLRRKLDDLPDNYRDVIYGFYIEEKTYQQLASEQHQQVKTIETKLYRARQWMKKHWKEDDF
ncbi:RNA polymerase sigma factor [Falsibacillus albus]|uniref:Sigma-70 family RNA polymerase sigma factor n=1 Tax=Falsibacillus albus TaxID=2478915 RepID=A0A3L7JVS3_9BACI|nr:sigma-70 family RNA polymerase sigma factor [Falsibacillus albus]RLQ93761.1 sigma-70 family RNA polymerase sigma factor [Falsibacillus albus]